MKKSRISIFSTIILALTLVASASPAFAETKGWGAGLNILDGEFGLQVRKDFWLGGDISQITGQGSVIFAGRTFFALDVDYHFIIKSTNADGTSSKSRFYPLVGLDFMFNSDGSEFGLNLGGGANFMMTDTLAAFAELKFVISDWFGDGLGIGVGVYF
ncbi:MAG: hypothetical protein ABFS42_16605 [Candidatus Krumholzibacteriota bacterium]